MAGPIRRGTAKEARREGRMVGGGEEGEDALGFGTATFKLCSPTCAQNPSTSRLLFTLLAASPTAAQSENLRKSSSRSTSYLGPGFGCLQIVQVWLILASKEAGEGWRKPDRLRQKDRQIWTKR